MTATDAPRTDDTDRLVAAPEGKTWINGQAAVAGEWASEEDALDFDHRRIEADGAERYVRVQADEPASMADLMKLAAKLEYLEEDRRRLSTALTALWSGLGYYLGRGPS